MDRGDLALEDRPAATATAAAAATDGGAGAGLGAGEGAGAAPWIRAGAAPVLTASAGLRSRTQGRAAPRARPPRGSSGSCPCSRAWEPAPLSLPPSSAPAFATAKAAANATAATSSARPAREALARLAAPASRLPGAGIQAALGLLEVAARDPVADVGADRVAARDADHEAWCPARRLLPRSRPKLTVLAVLTWEPQPLQLTETRDLRGALTRRLATRMPVAGGRARSVTPALRRTGQPASRAVPFRRSHLSTLLSTLSPSVSARKSNRNSSRPPTVAHGADLDRVRAALRDLREELLGGAGGVVEALPASEVRPGGPAIERDDDSAVL